MSDALDARIELLIIRSELIDLLAEYCECVDDNKLYGLYNVFTPDCVTDYGEGRGGRVVGAQALIDRIQSVLDGCSRTHHQIGQQRVKPRTDGGWDVVTYALAWHELLSGDIGESHVRYVDRVVRGDGGKWQIAERRLVTLGLEGAFRGINYRMLDRGA